MSIDISDRLDFSDIKITKSSPQEKVQGADYSVPDGEYLVEITYTKMVNDPNGNYAYLDICFGVLEPKELCNKAFYIKFFTNHATKEKMVNFQKKQLRDLGIACFGEVPKYGKDYVGGKCLLVVKRVPGNKKPTGTGYYPDSNQIKEIKSIRNSDMPTVMAEPSAQAVNKKQPTILVDDEIPF